MSRLSKKEFLDKVKSILGDRDDDEALTFLEDCNDTITDDKDGYKEKYEAAVKEKDELDKQWRTKYKERFYSSDNPSDKDKDNGKDKDKHDDPFDTRTDKEKEADSIQIEDLFKESEE